MRHYLWIFIIVLVIITAVLFPRRSLWCGDLSKVSGAEKMADKEKIIKLPTPKLDSGFSLEKAISKRRSVRRYSDKDLTLAQVSQLLWAAQGITDRIRGFRAAPSAGALYPLEIYLANRDGLFHYMPDNHILETVSSKDIRSALSAASLYQSSIAQAAVDIIICAVYERVTSKYGQRGIRYTDIEVGHAAENIQLQAVALGLSSVQIGAFDDGAVSKLLSLSEDEIPLYIIPVGYKR